MISQIPNLIAPNWQTRSREIYHTQVAISQIPPLRTHIWQVRSGHIYPIPHSDFTDSYSDSSYLADQVLTYLPSPPNSEFTDSYSESSYLAGQGLADLSPPLSTHFTDSYSESSYLDNQVLIDPPFSLCLNWQFHRFLLWELIFVRPGLTRFTLSNGNVTDSYSEGSYLADQVLADLPPQVAISQIPTLRIHIW